MNFLLQKMEDLKTFLAIIFALIFIGMIAGYAISPRPVPKDILCKKEIDQVTLLGHQIKTLRNDHLSETQQFQAECIKQQESICSQKVLRYRAACLELKCEVCKASR